MAPPPVAASPSAPLTLETVRPLAEVTAEAEKEYLRRVLELCLHNQTRAAKALGLSRGQVVTLIERYDLPRPRS
jgi:DNA-binding protein Fis